MFKTKNFLKLLADEIKNKKGILGQYSGRIRLKEEL